MNTFAAIIYFSHRVIIDDKVVDIYNIVGGAYVGLEVTFYFLLQMYYFKVVPTRDDVSALTANNCYYS